MPDHRLILLGTSSGVPQADRATSGYLLKVNDSLSLFDCGGGVTSSYLRRGFDPSNLDRIFILHTHPDHVCEIPLTVQMIYLAGRSEPFDIFVPEEFVEPLEKYLPAVYIFREKLPFDLNIVGYEPGVVYDELFELEATRNEHLIGNREVIEQFGYPNRMQSHSFAVKLGGVRWFYSGDIRSFADIREQLDGADVALLESTHFDLDELLELAPKISVGRIILTHLGEREQVEEIHRKAAAAGIDNIESAVDGMEVPLS